MGADTVVAIIETMKLMNSVPAGTPGRVARICVENGEFAPLGATLVLIEPDSPPPNDEPTRDRQRQRTPHGSPGKAQALLAVIDWRSAELHALFGGRRDHFLLLSTVFYQF